MRLIVVAGSPGSGKSTLAKMIREELNCPWIDYGRLREFHLLPDWSNQSQEEESMTFQNLVAIIQNYNGHGYQDVLVDDLKDHRVVELSLGSPGVEVCMLTLTLADPQVLRNRIATRDDGWKDQGAAIRWNQAVLDREVAAGEFRIDVTNLTPSEVFARAWQLLNLERDASQVN
jgi:predicted kinase